MKLNKTCHSQAPKAGYYLVPYMQDIRCTAKKFLRQHGQAATAHKGLNSSKRFTNLLSGSMSLIQNKMGLMHQYRSLGVPKTPKSHDALIKVFKFIRNKLHFLGPHFCTYIESETLKICLEVCEPFRRSQPSMRRRRRWPTPPGQYRQIQGYLEWKRPL